MVAGMAGKLDVVQLEINSGQSSEDNDVSREKHAIRSNWRDNPRYK